MTSNAEKLNGKKIITHIHLRTLKIGLYNHFVVSGKCLHGIQRLEICNYVCIHYTII